MTEVLQLLLIRNRKFADEVGPAMWAALEEMEQFYNFHQRRVDVRRVAFEPALPDPVCMEWPPRRSEAFGDRSDKFWNEVRGKYRRTIDQNRLVEAVRSRLPAILISVPMLLVTDQEIIPPPDWSYIIWDSTNWGSVISAAPLDPQYWNERTANRIGAIKHRVRVCGLSVMGTMLGLERCKNEKCFLYKNVESTNVLDDMLVLGPEHGWGDLAGFGYSPRPRNPEQLQSVTPPFIGSAVALDERMMSPEWNTYE